MLDKNFGQITSPTPILMGPSTPFSIPWGPPAGRNLEGSPPGFESGWVPGVSVLLTQAIGVPLGRRKGVSYVRELASLGVGAERRCSRSPRQRLRLKALGLTCPTLRFLKQGCARQR